MVKKIANNKQPLKRVGGLTFKVNMKPETRGRKPNKVPSEKMGLSIPGEIYQKLWHRAGIKTAIPQEIYKILAKELNIDLNKG